jgi:hypothetical protein
MARPIADFITEQQLGPQAGAPLPHRPCGGCMQCCTTLPVNHPELRKPAGTPCCHLASAGCGIYPGWPSVCRTYQCVWKLMSDFPEEARPDKCGVIFTFFRWSESQPEFLRASVVATAVNTPADFDHPVARACLDTLFRNEAMSIWLQHAGNVRRLFPDAELADAMINPDTTPHRHLLDRAAALRRKWEVRAEMMRPDGQ